MSGSVKTQNFPGETDKEFTLRFVLDLATARLDGFCDGRSFASTVSNRISKAGVRIVLGDGGKPVAGMVDIRSFKVGVWRESK